MSTNQARSGEAGWSRRTLLSVAAGAGAGLVGSGLAGCSGDDASSGSEDKMEDKIDNPPDNLNRKGFPIVEDSVTLHFMTGRSPTNEKDFNKVASWKKYQKMSNVTVDWGLVPFDSRQEKRNLTLSGNNYPEVFNTMGFSTRDVGKYGSQGMFVKLNSLIDEYMPNLKKLMSGNDEVRRGMTFPGGAVYGMPNIEDPDFTTLRWQQKMWVREDWLDKFDSGVPTTTDEFHRYLKTVKKRKPNGKDDAIPYCDESSLARLRYALMGSFGVGNRGTGQEFLDADPQDQEKVRFYRITDEYKALLEYLHRLYSEGLIAKNVFSIDKAKVATAAADGVYGSMVDQGPIGHYSAKNFVPMPPLKGPDGQRTYNFVRSALGGVGGFVITDKCKSPVASARWMDYFYSDEGARLFFMGVEGKSYKETKDGVEYLPKIVHPKKGVTTDEARAPYVTYMGGGYAGIVKEDYFKGIVSSEQSVHAAKVIEPYAQSKSWPDFTFTNEESEELDSLADDIEKYVDESTDGFIKGSRPLSDWKKYVEKIKKMGLEEYMKIQQAAYDRYRKA